MDRVTKLLLSVIATCLVCICAQGILAPRSAGAGGPPRAIVRAERFVLQDKDGKERALLTLDEAGPILVLTDAQGRNRAALGVMKQGPGLVFWDAKGSSRVGLALEKSGPALELLDERERRRVAVQAMQQSTESAGQGQRP